MSARKQTFPALPRRRFWRRSLGVLLLAWPAFFSNACLGYLYQAGAGQLEILRKRRPIAEVLQDPKVPATIKSKLRLVEEVREFARTRIGLRVEDTYREVSMLDRDSLAWNVTASRPLQFKEKTYYFPFVGRVPYLGFFEKADAEAHARQLEREGWETLISEVGGYSTLGWFDDPLISTQLSYSERSLANLVIHECSHATLWFEDDVTFNESFASFVGSEGSKLYFTSKWGKNSPRLKEWDRKDQLRKKLHHLFHQTAQKLEKLYESDASLPEKRKQKGVIIQELRGTLQERYSKALNPEWLRKQVFNNAYFLSFRRYKSGQTYFKKVFAQCNHEWPCFLQRMQELRAKSKEERQALLR